MNANEQTLDPQIASCVNPPKIFSQTFKEDGTIPNNKKLPLILYEQALKLPTPEGAGVVENLLAANGWVESWRNGIYAYHHYHSTAHEVLVVYQGMATVQLGGNHGITRTIRRGDVIVIPAGVAHKNLGASKNFGVVGAYPHGQTWDLLYGNAIERPAADKNIQRVPLPVADPIYGTEGPLMEAWAK